MAGETTRSRDPAGHAGLLNNLFALGSALAAFFESRAALFSRESKTALVQLVVIAACVIEAVMFFAFGYIFLVAAAVFGIATVTHVSWILIALVAAAVHFVFALILLLIAQLKMRRPLFRATIEELKKDREWLENLDETTPN
ncbi:MAG TPA: phage holin family protein [Chthoniobacterales bacterium]|jgi:uncharacterized membrane protein YqjE|nr:phage holin family protein [Chthoniobacterales bacterium]HXM74470.1 phage holin family protein [Chthoniobacterales bacterium]